MKTFTGLYTKWDSFTFTPRKYKINLVRTLAYRCIRICSSPRLILLQSALDDLKRILLLNGYPMGTVKHHMNDVIEKHQNKPYDIGKTKRRLRDRKTEHFKALTTNCHESAIADHVFLTNHRIKWDHFEIFRKYWQLVDQTCIAKLY